MTPIFSRSWLVKMTDVLELLMAPVSLRSAWLISRACKPNVRVAHLALDLGAWHQRGHRVHHHHIHRAAAHQHLDNLERLLASVGLRDQQFVDIDAQPLGIGRDRARAPRRRWRRCHRAAAHWR